MAWISVLVALLGAGGAVGGGLLGGGGGGGGGGKSSTIVSSPIDALIFELFGIDTSIDKSGRIVFGRGGRNNPKTLKKIFSAESKITSTQNNIAKQQKVRDELQARIDSGETTLDAVEVGGGRTNAERLAIFDKDLLKTQQSLQRNELTLETLESQDKLFSEDFLETNQLGQFLSQLQTPIPIDPNILPAGQDLLQNLIGSAPGILDSIRAAEGRVEGAFDKFGDFEPIRAAAEQGFARDRLQLGESLGAQIPNVNFTGDNLGSTDVLNIFNRASSGFRTELAGQESQFNLAAGELTGDLAATQALLASTLGGLQSSLPTDILNLGAGLQDFEKVTGPGFQTLDFLRSIQDLGRFDQTLLVEGFNPGGSETAQIISSVAGALGGLGAGGAAV